MKNSCHNLIHQLSETLDSLWRMDVYIKDAQKENLPEEEQFWTEYKKSLEKQEKMLKKQIEKVVRSKGLN